MGRFNDIMEHLCPKVVIEVCEEPHDTARGCYALDSSIAGSYREFERVVIDYMGHHQRIVMGMAMPPDLILDRASSYLDSVGGLKNAAFIGLSGSQGGMVHVLNQLSEGFKAESKRAYFTYIVDSFCEPLAFEQIVEVMREFKETLGAYSPQSFSYISPEAMAADYKSILWAYIDALTKHTNLWAY